jgi:hypothetical protein
MKNVLILGIMLLTTSLSYPRCCGRNFYNLQ